MKKIGIVGAGQAGQRIAVALSTFDDVSIAGIVDPVNGRDVLADPSSEWFIPAVSFYDDDDLMMAQGYDGVVVAADPVNVAHPLVPLSQRKIAMLARNNVTCPVLWERPLGIDPKNPVEALNVVPSTVQSVISWTRYGLPSKVVKALMSSGSFGDVIDFEIFVTLNCGLAKKKWRQLGDTGVLQPVHLLDSALEQIESMGLGRIVNVSARRQDATRFGVSFDEKWEILVSLDSGVTGRVIGIQYVGDSEFLYSLRSYKVIGTSGALVSAFGLTKFVDASGRESPISLASYGVDPRIVKAVEKLERFFRRVDGYPETAQCRSEAQALSECLRTWVDSIGSSASPSSYNLATPDDVIRILELGKSVVDSV